MALAFLLGLVGAALWAAVPFLVRRRARSPIAVVQLVLSLTLVAQGFGSTVATGVFASAVLLPGVVTATVALALSAAARREASAQYR